jgi:hypothetical protein
LALELELEELELELELLEAAALEVEELEVLEVVGTAVVVGDGLLGVIAAEVSRSSWGATVEVGVGVLVLEGVGVLVLVGQALATALPYQSRLCSARPSQASSLLISSVSPPLLRTTKS